MTIDKRAPEDWGEDSLTEFLDLIRDQQFATFANKQQYYKNLSFIDECFVRLANNLHHSKHLLVPHFLYRAHAAFRLSCATSMAGQSPETFLATRSCLEHAGYALLIFDQDQLGDRWLRRSENKDIAKYLRRKFGIENIKKAVSKRDRHLWSIFEKLYSRSIEHGAHPNEMALTGNADIREEEDQIRYFQIYLHGDGVMLEHALKSTAEVGLCALHVFQWMYQERFEILGLREVLFQLRRKV